MDAPQTCPVCNAPLTETYRSWNGYDIMRCEACGHHRTMILGDTAVDGSTIYPPFDQSRGWIARARRMVFGRFMTRRVELALRSTPGRRLLDYGCGSGTFAFAAQSRGFEATGLEPFSLLRTRVDAPRLVAGTLDSLGSDDRFDVITMWHVLEHVDEPRRVLGELRERMADSGRIVISVPFIDGWQAQVFKGTWFHLDPPRHLHHFSRRSLGLTLRSAGLEPVSWEWWMPEYGTSGWVQSAINVVAPVKNVLYETVKDRDALTHIPVWSRRLSLAISVVAAVPLMLVSLPLEALAAQRRRSAVLTVIARQRASCDDMD
jgi:SAM-dependent methyltransferase